MTHVPETEVDTFDAPGTVHFEDLAVGDRSPTREIHDVKSTDFVRYAGASGDFNPLHYDEAFATAAGYDGVFAMGMLNAGFLSSVVTKWLGLSSITYFRTQFEDIVWPGDDLVAYAEVTETDAADGSVSCDLVVENQDGETVVSGTAEATLPRTDDA